MRPRSSILLCLIFLTLNSRAESPREPPRRRLLMGALGDSITAASLADLPIPSADPDPENRVRAWAKRSIQPQFIFENKKTLSWASGIEVQSHYERLKKHLADSGDPRPLDILNVSYPGDRSYDLEAQARKIQEEMDEGHYDALKYVTIFIGNNDACSDETSRGTPSEVFVENLMRGFQILASIRQSEPIRILLLGIPRIPNLGAPSVRNASTVFGLSCETVRHKILHFCDPLLTWQDADEYEEKMEIVEDFNRLLRNSARDAMTRFPNLEIVYSSRLNQLPIPIGVMAIDCFHPGKSAQNAIAKEVWLDQPWFN